ncbi:MAG: HEPN domain-containing protein [Planctomycetota bacterium]
MNAFAQSQWNKGGRALASAAKIVDTDPDSAASRAYYAAFHGVTAVLACRGLSFTKHTAVRAALHRDLIQTALLPADLGRDYDYLLDLRETADYGGIAEASRASAEKAIAKASAILRALQPLLQAAENDRDA